MPTSPPFHLATRWMGLPRDLVEGAPSISTEGQLSLPGSSMTMSVDGTFGALQIGVLLAVFLFGIVTVQASAYYTRFSDDRKVFRFMVATVWILELGHTIAISYEVYSATITYFGRPDLYTRYPGLGVATMTGGMITACVQSFFAYRVYSVLPHPWRYVGLICIALTAMRAVASIYAGVEAILATSIKAYTERFSAMMATLFISGAVIDVIIAVSMLWFLVQRRDQALNRVVRLLDKLVAWTVGTGLLTSVTAVVIVITFMIHDDNLVWLALYFFLAKLYSNSALSALNARTTLREEVAKQDSVSMSRTRLREVANNTRTRANFNPIAIEMKTTTQMTVEHHPYNVPLPTGLDSPASDQETIKELDEMDGQSDTGRQPQLSKGQGRVHYREDIV